MQGMPRYYRHIRQGDQLIRDPEGIELSNLDAAHAETLDEIRDLLAESVRRGRDDWLHDAIVIMDENGLELMTIPFVEALPARLYKLLSSVLTFGSGPAGKL